MLEKSGLNTLLFENLSKSYSNELRKVVIPVWLGFYLIDLYFRPNFWMEWGAMRLLVAFFLYYSANIIEHRWVKNNFDLAFAILAYPMNLAISYMIYMTREGALSKAWWEDKM